MALKEDATSLSKEEFLKFLNCSRHSTKSERIVIAGPKNSKISLLKQFGNYSASGLKLEEFSLNKQILRIPLPKINLDNLSTRQVALRFRVQKAGKKRKRNNVVVSRFGRRLKKRQLDLNSLTGKKTVAEKLDKNRNRPTLLQLNKNNSILYKTKRRKQSRKKMATWSYRKPGPAKPTQFIIKYVPSEPTYFLKMAPLRHPEDGKLKYPFDTLVKDIKNMKLPSPTWKIKVVVKSNKIASIIFTNKCVLERTVSFMAKSDYFEVVLENRPAILLGAPNSVTCVDDIEILLNIIHTISAQNPMVYYKN